MAPGCAPSGTFTARTARKRAGSVPGIGSRLRTVGVWLMPAIRTVHPPRHGGSCSAVSVTSAPARPLTGSAVSVGFATCTGSTVNSPGTSKRSRGLGVIAAQRLARRGDVPGPRLGIGGHRQRFGDDVRLRADPDVHRRGGKARDGHVPGPLRQVALHGHIHRRRRTCVRGLEREALARVDDQGRSRRRREQPAQNDDDEHAQCRADAQPDACTHAASTDFPS